MAVRMRRMKSGEVSVENGQYMLKIRMFEAVAFLDFKGTHQRYMFFPSGACNPVGKRDETVSFGKIESQVNDQAVTLSFKERSSQWANKRVFFVCGNDFIEFFYQVEGKAEIERAHFFRGYFGGEERGMAGEIDEVYSTCPNFQEKLYFHPGESFTISAGNVLEMPVGCQAFASPCDCMGLHDRRDRKYLSVGLATQPGQYTWDAFQWNPPVSIPVTQYPPDNSLAGAFAAVYEGKLRVDGTWRSPKLVMTFARDRYDVLGQYLRHCYNRGYMVKPPQRRPVGWWREPIYCTWHDQVAMVEARSERDGSGGLTSASDTCTEKNCTRWIGSMEKNHCRPGIVILDDAWAVNRNSGKADPKKWPDMRGWIEKCHTRGIRVMLWVCAWSTDGIPAGECIMRDGTPVACDITNPEYLKRFRDMIRLWFSSASGCLNADGVKLDGMMSLPTGKNLRSCGNIWGLELQRLYLKTLYEEAKNHKPDVCISTYALNPYLAEFTDMVRAGDMFHARLTPHESLCHRVALYRIAMPNAVIDTDGQFSQYALDDYADELQRQAELGVPTLYNAERIARQRFFQPKHNAPVTKDDYKQFADVFAEYRRRMAK